MMKHRFSFAPPREEFERLIGADVEVHEHEFTLLLLCQIGGGSVIFGVDVRLAGHLVYAEALEQSAKVGVEGRCPLSVRHAQSDRREA